MRRYLFVCLAVGTCTAMNAGPIGADNGVPLDSKARARLQAAADLVRDRAWERAVVVLQEILDQPEERFVKIERSGADGKAARMPEITTARQEADRLLAGLPKEGLDAYEVHAGKRAADRLEEARKNGRAPIYAEVAFRYRHTRAGRDATADLGTHYLGRGQPRMAAACFEHLLSQEAYSPTPLILFKAAIAYRLAGERTRFDRALDRLAKRSPAGVRVGDQTLAIQDVRRHLEALHIPNSAEPDHSVFQGTVARTPRTPGGKPFLDETTSRWVMPMIHQEQTSGWVDQAAKHQKEVLRVPEIPAFFPIAARGRVVYRSYYGIEAVNLLDGTLAWKQDLEGAIDILVDPHRSPGRAAVVKLWVPMYQRAAQLHAIYEHSSLGTLATNGHLVFGVDDLGLLPHPNLGAPPPQQFGALAGQVSANRLVAIGLQSGKRIWQAGGPGPAAGPLGDAFFFGAPLPVGAQLFSIVEKESELALVCLDADTGKFHWKQPLLTLRTPVTRDPGRRLQAVNVAFDNGVLVCPTNAGHVFGFDPLARRVLWLHGYEDRVRAATSLIPSFKCSAPVTEDGRVVVAPPDADFVRCLDLRSGALLWEIRREDDLYLGGVQQGRVILVGKTSCRAVSLADGKELWNLGTGVPSGHGVGSGTIYYLPLRAAIHETEEVPEVCAIDVVAGRIVSRVRSRRREVPGNLIFHAGRVISQTVREVSAYPQLDAKLAEMTARMARNPKDPRALLERADLRRSDGDFAGAVQDLRLALANAGEAPLQAQARHSLFESLTDLLEREFTTDANTLGEYAQLVSSSVPEKLDRKQQIAEQQRRQAIYHRVLGRGFEQKKHQVDALEHFEQLARLSDTAGMLPGVEDPRLRSRAEPWVRARIRAMVVGADAEQRKKILEAIGARYEKARRSKNADELRLFVALFAPVLSEAELQP